MSFRDRWRARLVALVGLDFDFTEELRRKRFSEISDTLYVGRRPQTGDVEELKDAGITHVISCLPESERGPVAFLAAEFRGLFVPIHDGIHEDISSAFPRVFDFAARASTEHIEPKLLVHCQVGVSRSATMAIAWMMKLNGSTFFDTFKQVHTKRPEILPNIGFASQLARLEHAMHPNLRASQREKGEASSLARYLRDVCRVPVDLDLLEESLGRHDYDAPRTIRALFGDEIPRVVQGVRL